MPPYTWHLLKDAILRRIHGKRKKKIQTGYKEKAFHHKDHQISEKVAQTSCAVAYPWKFSRPE